MSLKNTKLFKKSDHKEKFVPFEKQNEVKPLKLFISIVPFGQGPAIIKLLEENRATYSYMTTGEGTGKNFLPSLLSVSDPRKQIVFTFVREDKSKEVCDALEKRFSTSKASSGISVSVKLTSVAGVSVYRFLTNIRKVKKVQKDDEF